MPRGVCVNSLSLWCNMIQKNTGHYFCGQFDCGRCQKVVSVGSQSHSEILFSFTVWNYFHSLFRVWIWPDSSGCLEPGFSFPSMGTAFLGCQVLSTQRRRLCGINFLHLPIPQFRTGFVVRGYLRCLPWEYFIEIRIYHLGYDNLWDIYICMYIYVTCFRNSQKMNFLSKYIKHYLNKNSRNDKLWNSCT